MYSIFCIDKPRDTLLFINPGSLTLNAEIQIVCFATAVPGVKNYKFYRNGILIGNKTDGRLSLKIHPSNCTMYEGEYKCVPESPLGDGEVKAETRKFNCKLRKIFFLQVLSFVSDVVMWQTSNRRLALR